MGVIHVHVDADDLWIYAGEYGIPPETIGESVYDDALPRFLELFEEGGVKATFFVVASDLLRENARAFVRTATEAGHEIANHSFSHPVALHRLTAAEKEREVTDAHAAIADATGRAPVGFRAPGYYLDADLVRALEAHDYLYDSSILPSFIPPLIKLYIRLAARQSIDKQFGTSRAGFASQAPRRIGDHLFELPVSVLPGLRVPIHSTFSFQLPAAGRQLINASLRLRREAVLLFHAIDAITDVSSVELRARVLPLRLPFERRVGSIRAAVEAVADRATTTTRERFEAAAPDDIARSRVLRVS